MALQKNIEIEGASFIKTDAGNINFGNQKVLLSSYIKVLSLSGDKEQMLVTVNFKSSNNTFNKNYKFAVSVDATSKNFIAQAYDYLKTLPEFEGATDC